MQNSQLVLKFHDEARCYSPDRPTRPDADTVKLRRQLIKEEAHEVDRALEKESLANIAKELADLLYVVYGTAVAYGIPIDTVFHLVHESNMSKFGPDGPVVDARGKIQKSIYYKNPMAEIEHLIGKE